jgi:hypothetical protein
MPRRVESYKELRCVCRSLFSSETQTVVFVSLIIPRKTVNKNICIIFGTLGNACSLSQEEVRDFVLGSMQIEIK